MSEEYLTKERDRIFAGQDRLMLLHVGYFITWYNHVEWKLTVLMAIVMGERDFPAFHQLVLGLDAKTKVRRLRKLCQIKKRKIEENFDNQLTHFHETICDLRNKFAHRALLNDETGKDRFHFATLEKMPWKVLGVSAKGQPPDHIDGIKMFEYGYWMNHWGDDLNEIIDRAIASKSLGTETPRAKLP
jgi:hypothetical protein